MMIPDPKNARGLTTDVSLTIGHHRIATICSGAKIDINRRREIAIHLRLETTEDILPPQYSTEGLSQRVQPTLAVVHRRLVGREETH